MGRFRVIRCFTYGSSECRIVRTVNFVLQRQLSVIPRSLLRHVLLYLMVQIVLLALYASAYSPLPQVAHVACSRASFPVASR